MEELQGTIDSIIFKNEENGYTIARMIEKGKLLPTTITGSMLGIQPGEKIICQGKWVKNKKFGLQFNVERFDLDNPTTSNAIEMYLASGIIKGIGPSLAKRIVRKFSNKTLDVFDNDPEKLLSIKGISKKTLEKILKSWKEKQGIRQVMIFLQKFGISPAYAQKIYKSYGVNSPQKVRQNPYRLASEVVGIGFKKADEIAQSMQIAQDSSIRIQAGIDYTLLQLSRQGNTCYPYDLFIDEAAQLLAAAPQDIRTNCQEMIEEQRLKLQALKTDIGPKDFVWSRRFFNYEQSIAEELFRLEMGQSLITHKKWEKDITNISRKQGIQLATQQSEAVLKSLEKKVHIITGGPGTGKSTITKVILGICRRYTDKIILAAPTGRASKRLSQITKKEASTIHSLLQYQFGANMFGKNQYNQLDCDLIIVDEASMIDTFLMKNLLAAIPNKAKLILVGDIDQLPSVGAGNVLRDLILSQKIPCTVLTEIFRQALDSQIVVNAHKVNQGVFPNVKNAKDADFFFIPEEQSSKISTLIQDLVATRLPKAYELSSFEEIQVLSPTNKGEIGNKQLNIVLQNRLNPAADHKTEVKRGQQIFRLGDKVMQTRNNYDKGVFNGDMGFIQNINFKDKELEIDYEGKWVQYDFNELQEIELAYAVSIHKYQGSECPCVVIPLHYSAYMLLSRNLLYTGITRGKQLVIIIGSTKAMKRAIENNSAGRRYTGLCQALVKEDIEAFPPIKILPKLGSQAYKDWLKEHPEYDY